MTGVKKQAGRSSKQEHIHKHKVGGAANAAQQACSDCSMKSEDHSDSSSSSSSSSSDSSSDTTPMKNVERKKFDSLGIKVEPNVAHKLGTGPITKKDVEQLFLSRNDIVKLLKHPLINELIIGCFVRVVSSNNTYRFCRIFTVNQAKTPYQIVTANSKRKIVTRLQLLC